MTDRPWRLEIRHSTGFRYTSDVTASHNEVRLSPRSADGQWVLSHRVDVTPSARLARFTDYWGTVVHAFDLRRAHRELCIVATSQVETTPHSSGSGAAWAWRDLDDVDEQDVWCELLMPTRYTEADDAIRGLAESVRAAPDPAAAVDRALELVQEHLEYRKGVTTVDTTAAEALETGVGVCQDFVHVTLAILRAAGVPCRYASGYLSPQAGADIGETVAGESHAWLDAWAGKWIPVDPTNGRPVGPDHVLVARGRDYADVPPLRGVYLGGHADSLDVTVEITRRA